MYDIDEYRNCRFAAALYYKVIEAQCQVYGFSELDYPGTYDAVALEVVQRHFSIVVTREEYTCH